MNSKKYNVIALGARDYYQVAIALNENMMLNRLITDFYCPNILRKYINKRFSMELDSKNTTSLYIFSILQSLFKGNKSKKVIDFLFGFISAIITYFTTNQAIVYSYYIEGFSCFYRIFRLRPKKMICFQVHPTPWFINSIIENDKKLFSEYHKIEFHDDIEVEYSEADERRYLKSLSFFDKIICASSITAKSIFYKNKIEIPFNVIPYGSKFQIKETNQNIKTKNGDGIKIKLLSVCQLSQRKGLHWAFKAMEEIKCMDSYEWIIVGNHTNSNLASIAPKNVIFKTNLTNIELAKLMEEADLFVMPSLIEGFGLVYIESLSMGTPIVYTKNTGAPDFVTNGVHGLEVDCSSISSLKYIFEKICSNEIDIKSMRSACIKKSQEINWDNFKKGIISSLAFDEK